MQFYESEEYHIIPDLLQMKKEGKIRYFGFSCHAGPELLDSFLTRHEGVFDFVQIQLNYLDWTMQDAKEKCDIIRKHGLGIWVMEPVRGKILSLMLIVLNWLKHKCKRFWPPLIMQVTVLV